MSAFEPLFVPDELEQAVAARAWLEAMLDFERGLANAEALVGVISADAAAAITEACDPDRFDVRALAVDGRATGNFAEPLVRALRARVDPIGVDAVHLGATSQDVVDTAAAIVARRAIASILESTDRLAAAAARLARDHRGTVMAGRTLLQQAVPTTFGLTAAGWLVAVVEAREGLLDANGRLALQLGGAAGTLAALGADGPAVAEQLAAQLGLELPPLPWHGNRTRIAELGSALAVLAGVAAKIGVDVALLQQSEIAEVRDPGAGGSSTMPQKQNPVASALAVACARSVAADAGVLLASLVGEHGQVGRVPGIPSGTRCRARSRARAAASTPIAGLLERIEVDRERMRANLGEATLSERAALALTKRVGHAQARAVLSETASLRAALRTHFDEREIDELLDPAGYLGAADAFVEGALARYADAEES